MIFQIVGRRLIGRALVVAGAGIEACIVGGETAFHLTHHGRFDVQIARDGIHFIVVQPGKTLLGATQVEEQLALSLGGRDLHDAPVTQHELVNLGLDPMHGKGDEAYALMRVETLDRLHQADVTFLDQVRLLQAIAAVAARDMHDEAQVRHDESTGRLQMILFMQPQGQLMLFFGSKHSDTVHRLNIAV